MPNDVIRYPARSGKAREEPVFERFLPSSSDAFIAVQSSMLAVQASTSASAGRSATIRSRGGGKHGV